jgi:hypothetical protein
MNLSSASNLLVQLEIFQDMRDLAELGLSPEEIDGYVAFFIDNFFPQPENVGASYERWTL